MTHNDVMRHGLRKSNEDFGKALQLDEGTNTNSLVGTDTCQMTCYRDKRVCVRGTHMTWDVGI
jgi:hypothetical protein